MSFNNPFPKKVLIVVDMQKDFVDQGGKLTLPHDTTQLTEGIARYIKDFKGRILYTLDSHDEDSCEFETFPKHCIRGTEGHKLNDTVAAAIKEVEQRDMRNIGGVEKVSYTGSELIDFLTRTFPEGEFHVVGVCTHICVHDIATSLVNSFKAKYNKVPKIVIPKELVDDFDPEMAAFALKRMQNLYGVEVA